MTGIGASYFDGQSTRRQPAELLVAGDEIVARGAFGERRAGRGGVEISEAMGHSPRFVRFPDGTAFEVADLEAFAHWLAEAGFADSPVVRLQKRWSWALGALAATAALVFGFYFLGLPALARVLAPAIPDSARQSLSRQTLSFLDDQLLAPSALDPARRAGLERHVRALLPAGDGVPAYRLHFRASSLGPNAFALPGGDIVILDQLIELARNDDELAGVVAHELGHVVHHHGMRQLIQSSVVAFVLGVYLGDVSSTAASLGALVLESRYSRQFEFEADAYGGGAMRAAGRGAEPLAAMLERLEAAHGAGGRQAGWAGLSSHPETAERIRRLRAMR